MGGVSKSQKDKRFVIPLTGSAENSQTHRSREQSGGCQGLEGGEVGSCSSTRVKFQLYKMSNPRNQLFITVPVATNTVLCT